ncbi:dienelactone hydrolase family protein [Miniimonas arenae]|uniref:Dienelactone hydrolase family protein n=1 Tax=Miniimonas arenae TaxID=676201 RepID=A0A5C5B9I2_9MICO|nr:MULTISPECIES: dienelactone hydrolase family protein [Miniimonas]TNU73613.1 dienelactone hydrolase family protein [Miniimonas arenae]
MSTPSTPSSPGAASAPADDIASIPTPDGELPVRLYLPSSGTGPGLVLVQEIFGVSRYVEARAADLAALGYVVAVPELYWRIGLAATPEDGDIQDVLGAGMSAAERLGLEHAVADTDRTLAWLPTHPAVTGPVGLIGFCFGGGVAFAVAAARAADPDAADPAVLVSYYGSSIPAQAEADAERAGAVTVPSLHHWGEVDAFIPGEAQEATRAVLDGEHPLEWFTYPGANHAFDNPHPAFHHADASALAWERTKAFLAAHLPVA